MKLRGFMLAPREPASRQVPAVTDDTRRRLLTARPNREAGKKPMRGRGNPARTLFGEAAR
jgi:hypothetical protein